MFRAFSRNYLSEDQINTRPGFIRYKQGAYNFDEETDTVFSKFVALSDWYFDIGSY